MENLCPRLREAAEGRPASTGLGVRTPGSSPGPALFCVQPGMSLSAPGPPSPCLCAPRPPAYPSTQSGPHTPQSPGARWRGCRCEVSRGGVAGRGEDCGELGSVPGTKAFKVKQHGAQHSLWSQEAPRACRPCGQEAERHTTCRFSLSHCLPHRTPVEWGAWRGATAFSTLGEQWVVDELQFCNYKHSSH